CGDREGAVLLPPRRRVVLAGSDDQIPAARGQVWDEARDHLQLVHDKAALNARASASGSAAVASARRTQTLWRPAATTSGSRARSSPPIANTGTWTAAWTAATPSNPITRFSDLIGVSKAGPVPR